MGTLFGSRSGMPLRSSFRKENCCSATNRRLSGQPPAIITFRMRLNFGGGGRGDACLMGNPHHVNEHGGSLVPGPSCPTWDSSKARSLVWSSLSGWLKLDHICILVWSSSLSFQKCQISISGSRFSLPKPSPAIYLSEMLLLHPSPKPLFILIVSELTSWRSQTGTL